MSRPCPERSRYIPKSIAAQRGLSPDRRHRERVSPQRFVVHDGPGPRPAVCVPPDGVGRGGRTSCYASHSARRKHCPLLSLSGEAPEHPPGLYVTGLPPYAADEDGLLRTLVFGPYVTGPMDVGVKRVSFLTVFGEHRFPENVVLRMHKARDPTVPSIGLMRDFGRRLERVREADLAPDLARARRNALECVADLKERADRLDALRRRCSQNPRLQRVARRLCRNVFMFAMYARRWAGPGEPYPVSRAATQRLVGRHAPLSEELRDAVVDVTPLGEVRLRDGTADDDAERADHVENGKAAAMMQAYLLACFQTVDSSPDGALLMRELPVALSPPTSDESHWPGSETLWEVLFGQTQSVSCGDVCIRQISSTLLDTCRLLATVLYRSPPVWMRYEGRLDEIQ